MKKNPLLNSFLYFRKWNFLAPSSKNSCFLGESLTVFHHCFFRCFSFQHLFLAIVFWVFLLLIAFVPFTDFLYPDCFFVRHLVFVLLYRECCGFERASFCSQVFFTLHTLHKLLLSTLPWEPTALP